MAKCLGIEIVHFEAAMMNVLLQIRVRCLRGEEHRVVIYKTLALVYVGKTSDLFAACLTLGLGFGGYV